MDIKVREAIVEKKVRVVNVANVRSEVTVAFKVSKAKLDWENKDPKVSKVVMDVMEHRAAMVKMENEVAEECKVRRQTYQTLWNNSVHQAVPLRT